MSSFGRLTHNPEVGPRPVQPLSFSMLNFFFFFPHPPGAWVRLPGFLVVEERFTKDPGSSAALVCKRMRSVGEYSFNYRSINEYSFTDGETHPIRGVRSWTVSKRMNPLPVHERMTFQFIRSWAVH